MSDTNIIYSTLKVTNVDFIPLSQLTLARPSISDSIVRADQPIPTWTRRGGPLEAALMRGSPLPFTNHLDSRSRSITGESVLHEAKSPAGRAIY